MIVFLRSLIFNLAFMLITMVLGTFGILTFPAPLGWHRAIQRLWSKLCLGAAKSIVGIDLQIEGRENIPSGSVIFACKHQSAWETVMFAHVFCPCVFVLKKELLYVPIFGWFGALTHQIVLNREGGAAAVRHLIAEGKRVRSEGRSVILFPEGSRMAPGTQPPLLPGVVAMARYLDMPVVPVALNSGRLWGKRAFLKYPGVVSVKIMPAIAKDISKQALLDALHTAINTPFSETA